MEGLLNSRQDLSYLNGPTSVASFACIGVNVMGPGIDPLVTQHNNPNPDPIDWQGLYNGTGYCGYRGITSRLITNENGAQLSMDIPPGPGRIIQVIGTPAGSNICPTAETFSEFEDRVGEQQTRLLLGDVFVLGQTVADLFQETTLSIPSTYSSANPRNYNACHNGTSLPLTAAGYGYTTSPSYSDALNIYYDYSIPPTMSYTAMSASQLNDVTDGNPSTEIGTGYYGVTGTVARMDFVFDTTGYNLASATGLKIELIAAGGSVNGACAGYFADTAGMSFRASGNTNAWTANGGSNTTTATVLTQFDYLYQSPDVPSAMTHLFTTVAPSSGTTGTPYIVLTVRSDLSGSTKCSVLRVADLRVSLIY